MLDTILEGDHPRIISAKFGWEWPSIFREDFSKFHLPFFLFLAWRTSWLEVGIPGHIFGRGPRTNCNQTLVEWSLDGPLPKMCPGIPTSNQDVRQAKNRKKGRWNLEKSSLTHFWKRTIQWLFHQNLVLIEQMVSDKNIFMGISHRVLCKIKFCCGGHLGRRS
jgi:hypothetical protein